MSTSSKDKASVSTSSVEAYNKKTLGDKIYRLTTANTQLMADKMETEKTRVNLETDKTRLFGEKNSLVVKKKELRTKIAALNAINVPVYSYQDPLLRPIRDKLKAKRLPPFDDLKKNL